MPRSPLAHLYDIIDCCAAIETAMHDVDLATYKGNRLVRSAVEREFTIIGEAIGSLKRLDPENPQRYPASTRSSGFASDLPTTTP